MPANAPELKKSRMHSVIFTAHGFMRQVVADRGIIACVIQLQSAVVILVFPARMCRNPILPSPSPRFRLRRRPALIMTKWWMNLFPPVILRPAPAISAHPVKGENIE